MRQTRNKIERIRKKNNPRVESVSNVHTELDFKCIAFDVDSWYRASLIDTLCRT